MGLNVLALVLVVLLLVTALMSAWGVFFSTLLPYQVVMTYAYVNPVIAVFLGWLILSEEVTGYTLFGAVLVTAGVAGIFNNRR